MNLRPKLPYLDIFRLTFEKNSCHIFQNAIFCAKLKILGSSFKKLFPYWKLALSNLSKCKVSCKTKNLEIWDQKYLIFKQDVEKNYCHIWDKHSQICHSETNWFKTKKTLSLQPKYLFFCKFRLEYEKTIVIFDISTL